MRAVRSVLQVLGLLALEVALLVVVYAAGPALGTVPFHHLGPWLDQRSSTTTLTALGRLVVLVVGWWLLASTLFSVVTHLRQSTTGEARPRRWLFPYANRMVQWGLGVSMLASTVAAGSSMASAAPMHSTAVVRTVGPSHRAAAPERAEVSERGERSEVVQPRSSAAVSVPRHLPHPGRLVHQTPLPPPASPNPSAPSAANSFAGLAPGTKVVEVKPGDCLSMIAENHLSDWRLDSKIFELNVGRVQPDGRSLQNENWIYPGWVLIMPADAHDTLVVGATNPGPVTAPTAVTAGGGPASASSGPATVAGGSTVGPATSMPAPVQSPGAAAATVPTVPAAAAHVSPAPGGTATTSPAKATSPAVATGNDGAVGGSTASRSKGRVRGPVVALPAELLAAGLLSAGLVMFLRRRTTKQRMHRQAGRVIPRPTGEQARVELAARIGADDDGAEFLDIGLRYLALAVRATEADPPVVLGAELHPDALVFLLAEEVDAAPDGFELGDDRLSWVLPRPEDLADLHDLAGDVVVPLPLLVTLGHDGDVAVMVNAEAVGMMSLTGDGVAAQQMVAAVSVELATSSWSEMSRLYLVGFARPDGLGDSPAVTVVDTVEDCLAALRGDAGEHCDAADDTGRRSAVAARFYGDGADIGPSLVLCVHPPSEVALDALAALAGDARNAVAVIVAGDVAEHVSDDWRLEVDDETRVDIGPLGRQVDAQVVPLRMLATIEQRISATLRPADVDPAEQVEHWYDPVTAVTAGNDSSSGDDELDDEDDDDVFDVVDVEDLAGRPHSDDGDIVAAPERAVAGSGPGPGSSVVEARPVSDGDAGDVAADVADMELTAVIGRLRDLPVMLPAVYRQPEILLQVLRPFPRAMRRGADGLYREVRFPRTRSLEAAVYRAFHPDAPENELCDILAPGHTPKDESYRVIMSGARTALGKNHEGEDYLSKKRKGVGQDRLLDTVATDWAIFHAVSSAINEASAAGDVDLDTAVEVLDAALDLVAGCPYADVPMRSRNKGWKWADMPPKAGNMKSAGDMKTAILDVAHWQARLCLNVQDSVGASDAIAVGRAVSTIDVSINCDYLDMAAADGLDALDAAYEAIYAGYLEHPDIEDNDEPIATEVRDHWMELRVAGGAVRPAQRRRPSGPDTARTNGNGGHVAVNGNGHAARNGNGQAAEVNGIDKLRAG